MSLMVLALLAAAQDLTPYPPVVSGPIPAGKPFVGGPYDGLAVGLVNLPDGRAVRGLIPSKPNASRVNNPRDREIVEAFVAGHEKPDAMPLANFVSKKSIFINCQQIGAACNQTSPVPILFGEPVIANTPYRRPDGRVRIEWLYGGALYYLSELKISNGKIALVRTQPAWPPFEIKRDR